MAAAMWAVFHYYAQDAAGSRRARERSRAARSIARHDRSGQRARRHPGARRSRSMPRPPRSAGQLDDLVATVDVSGSIVVALTAGARAGARRADHIAAERSGRRRLIVLTDGSGSARIDGAGRTRRDDCRCHDAGARVGPRVSRARRLRPDPQGAQNARSRPAPPAIGVAPPPTSMCTVRRRQHTTTTEAPTTTTDAARRRRVDGHRRPRRPSRRPRRPTTTPTDDLTQQPARPRRRTSADDRRRRVAPPSHDTATPSRRRVRHRRCRGPEGLRPRSPTSATSAPGGRSSGSSVWPRRRAQRERSSTLDDMTPVEALERVVHCLDRAHETGFKTKAFVRALDVVRATPTRRARRAGRRPAR